MIPQIYMAVGMSCLCFWALVSPLFALGTTAGTRVFNTVEVSFRINDDPQTLHVERANDVFTVSEIIRSDISSLNPEGVVTPTPGQNVPLSFQLTNTGNGTETFSLSALESGTGDFSAEVVRIWLETNGKPGLQEDDTPYSSASGVSLEADEGVTVYVASDIPAGLSDQASSTVLLQATSMTPGAKDLDMGEAIEEGGDNGIEVVVAQDKASDQDTGNYVVSGIRLLVDKAIAAVKDPYQGNLVMPGAEITYRITVQAEGVGLAKGLKIHDPAPVNMTYKANSLALNGLLLTDGQDSDGGYFDVAGNTVWFTPGDLVAPSSQVYTVTYVVD